ncbi:MAG: sodium-dependent transporter, partial [Eubacterium sp.]|nr:sodium-dependent transporter [Eubacterium sp.]
QFGWSRKKACFINIPLMILLSLPCALGPNLLSGFQPLGPGSQVLDLEDFIVSILLLPLGSLVFLLFCVLKAGWGWDNFSHEANLGEGMKVKSWMRPYMTYVLPFIIGIVFIMNLF